MDDVEGEARKVLVGGPKNVKFRRAEPEHLRPGPLGRFAVFETWGDLGQKHVACSERCVAGSVVS